MTHKKSVIDYCLARARGAGRAAPRDAVGYALVWELLALMLRQNGVVVGSDIAELLMKNARDYDYKLASKTATRDGNFARSKARGKEGAPPSLTDRPSAGSRRGSSASGASAEAERAAPAEQARWGEAGEGGVDDAGAPAQAQAADERAALDRFKECLTYGNRQEALGESLLLPLSIAFYSQVIYP